MNQILARLASALGELPGIGRKTAERLAIRLVAEKNTLLKELLQALQSADAGLCSCSLCGAITEADRNPCRLCSDPHRNRKFLCVVEEPADILLIEKSGAFNGIYHALMGKISPAEGLVPENLRLARLLERVREENIQEILLAMNTDMESDATAAYLKEKLAPMQIRISRLAFGLPVGSGVAYSDSVTLAKAIEGRRPL